MAPAKKKTTTPGPTSAKAKVVAAGLAAAALEQLKDPKVQEKLAEQARLVAERAKVWRDDRATHAPAGRGEATRSKFGAVGDRLEQRRLERRVKRLEASVADLAGGRPELAGPLAGPTTTLKVIGSALAVAGELPSEGQHRAHVQIGQELDQLEKMVFDVAMPRPE